MTRNYDRRAPAVMLEALEPGGWAHSLVQYGVSGMCGLDLQLRGYAPKPGSWVTLYVGTTKVLDLNVTAKGSFKMSAHGTYRTAPGIGWDSGWETRHSAEWFARRWDDVERYLDNVVEMVVAHGSHLKEGLVQSAISRFPDNEFVVIDREAVVGYTNDPERKAHHAQIRSALHRSLETDHPDPWWSKLLPTGLNSECDVLAVSPRGQLLAIEVKPYTAKTGVASAPVQAVAYAELFQSWLSQDPDKAVAIIRELLGQKQRVGLRPHGPIPALDPTLPVRPVAVVDSRTDPTYLKRVLQVADHLREADPGWDVHVHTCNLVGRFSAPLTSV